MKSALLPTKHDIFYIKTNYYFLVCAPFWHKYLGKKQSTNVFSHKDKEYSLPHLNV